MYATPCRMHTGVGLRRILKKKGNTLDRIRQSVESGTFRTYEEKRAMIKERFAKPDDVGSTMRRFRMDIVRGSHVTDYPPEFLILQKSGALTELDVKLPSRWYKKMARKRQQYVHPTAYLTETYMQKLDRQARDRGYHFDQDDDEYFGGPVSVEDYYQKLFHVEAPHPATVVGRKHAQVQKAYSAAMKHYELERCEGLSEKEALRQVEEILMTQDRQEMDRLKKRKEEMDELEKKVQAQAKERGIEKDEVKTWQHIALQELPLFEEGMYLRDLIEDDKELKEFDEINRPLGASVFSGNMKTIDAMMRWGDRLRSVPYAEWTIGAATALDHWVALEIMGMNPDTWQELIEGNAPHLIARGRDLIGVRESLFPETKLAQYNKRLNPDDSDDEYETVVEEDAASAQLEENISKQLSMDEAKEKSIDELLESIGGLAYSGGADDTGAGEAGSDDGANEGRTYFDRLSDELQDWRRKNMDAPFESWSGDEQDKFNKWMKNYVATLSTEAQQGQKVDYDATRTALLSQPPASRDEAEKFWGNLQDESLARVLLEDMRKDGPPPGANVLHAAFWDLPYNEQLDRLLNLGALRPILDDYSSVEDRHLFLKRYSDALLDGVYLEHLIPDPYGPINAYNLPDGTLEEMGYSDDMHFRLVKVPYRSETVEVMDPQDGTVSTATLTGFEKSRLMYQLWNHFKAGRAQYEEMQFAKGELGIRYNDKTIEYMEYHDAKNSIAGRKWDRNG